MSSIVVAMPAYNEAEGIPEFLHEISVAFSGLDLQFVVVDDCSADGTANVVKDLGLPGMHALRNEVNSGHGPSTLRALQEALDLGGDIIVAVDGDGQFLFGKVNQKQASLFSGRQNAGSLGGGRVFGSQPNLGFTAGGGEREEQVAVRAAKGNGGSIAVYR